MTVNRWWLGDVVLAVLLAVLGVVSTVLLDRNTDVDRPVDALALALVAGAGLVLVARRRRPVATLAAVTVLTSTYLVLGYPYGPFLLSFAVAMGTVASRLPLARSGPVALAALLVLVAHVFLHPGALPGYVGLIAGTVWAVVPFAVGVAVAQTRRAAERDRAEVLRERVYDERLRVAREVHDVVGHGLAAIKMQADIALHVLAKKPEQAPIALSAISRTSTEALAELRATLAVVRSAEPGLDQLDDLRERMREAGVQVRLETTGPAPDLPAAVGHAGYRVVQESLTNVLRHSRSRVATVRVGYPAGAVRIAVSNPLPAGEATLPAQGGFGIAGMRDRVTALGGEFTAGPTPDGRFEVRARIPTGGRP